MLAVLLLAVFLLTVLLLVVLLLAVLLLASTLKRYCRWISRKSNVSAMLGISVDSALNVSSPFEVARDFSHRAGMVLAAIQINRAACHADR